MKILIFPLLAALFSYLLYKAFFVNKNKKKSVNPNKTIYLVGALLVASLLGFSLNRFYLSIGHPDTYCLAAHTTASHPPLNLLSAKDYFDKGNYSYDIGSCQQAVIDYSKSIELDSTHAETFNNRAYTYMRMQNYKNAAVDLDKAIKLRPNYVNALINRGDIYNFYYQIDHSKAITLYEKVISLGSTKGNSVCGHKAMAMSNNILPFAFFRYFFTNSNCK